MVYVMYSCVKTIFEPPKHIEPMAAVPLFIPDPQSNYEFFSHNFFDLGGSKNLKPTL